MNGFPRDIEGALARSYDLIVIGGGIYGMTLTLEAARRGLRPLLVDRGDFGGETSLNSLRILHGGLRYLQYLDFPRFFESVSQRGWLMSQFAPLCRILPCLMPLYGDGLKRPWVFRCALTLNDLLSKTHSLPRGRILDCKETIARFPRVRQDGLQGAALWYDGQMLSPQRLHSELLRWAVACGARVLNYVEAYALERNGSILRGILTSVGAFKAPVVINAAGPWCREVAARLDRDQPGLMTPSLTFNVLLDVPPPSDAAVAVQGSRLYFVTPLPAGMTFAGTVHRPWVGLNQPDESMIDEFVEDLNRAIPGWELQRSNVQRVTAGVLPAKGVEKADMACRSTFIRHEISGLFSICGIKYTTAQRFAVESLRRIFGQLPDDKSVPVFEGRETWVNPDEVAKLSDEVLRKFAIEEAVTCVEDFMERRIDWILNPIQRNCFVRRICNILPVPPKAVTPCHN